MTSYPLCRTHLPYTNSSVSLLHNVIPREDKHSNRGGDTHLSCNNLGHLFSSHTARYPTHLLAFVISQFPLSPSRSALQSHLSASWPAPLSPCPRTPSPCLPDSPPLLTDPIASARMCLGLSHRASPAGRTAWSVRPSRTRASRRWRLVRTVVMKGTISDRT
jgi:hypothetical protein